jgi:hypothetical protein
MAKKPVVEVRERSPFGESVDESIMQNPTRTRTFIPGYSDARIAQQRAIADGDDVTPLKHRLHWVRAERASGGADNRRIADMKAKGYRVPTWDELKTMGYDMDSSAAHKGASGEAILGDTVLMITDAAIANTHYKRVREATANQFDDLVKGPLERSAADANARMGYKGKGATAFEFDEPEQQGKKGK